ncbi:hypothetical protein [Rhizohabitans arisaemae]|uniref:hypothetical protein n=1 Tax=Rhizohabitans arisaemae TaxID=2720610 RepID=UPI0024B277D9|nr:hypothetical protein [Rhizohabitans arisaemae]
MPPDVKVAPLHEPVRPAADPPPAAPERRSLGDRLSDIPVRIAYTVAAAFLAVVLIVVAFLVLVGFGDADPSPSRVRQLGVDDGAAPAATLSPTAPAASPSPSAVLIPPPPALKRLPVLKGTGTQVIAPVVDDVSGITYGRLARPWRMSRKATQVLTEEDAAGVPPQALVRSRPLPASLGGLLTTPAAYRAAAARAVRWTLRSYPEGAAVTWRGSQPVAATGRNGWTLLYEVGYFVAGVRHSSLAAVVVVETDRERPALLTVTVPDGERELWPDVLTLIGSVRPATA